MKNLLTFIVCLFATSVFSQVDVIDTVMTFDPVTYAETVTIVKNGKVISEEITVEAKVVEEVATKKKKDLKGKKKQMETVIDTVIIYDPATKTETIQIIERVKGNN